MAVRDTVAVRADRIRYEVAGRVILDGVSLEVGRGSSVAVTGPSGSGKTTLLMCLSGLLRPSDGSVWVGDVEVSRAGAEKRAATRLRSIGMIYQFGELLPELTPLENVALPALLAKMPRDEAFRHAAELLDAVGVGALSGVPTSAVSGGERQRISTARALITRPALILADEPTGSLDRGSADSITDLLYSLPVRFGCALIVVTHNEPVARRADRCVQLVDGDLREVSW